MGLFSRWKSKRADKKEQNRIFRLAKKESRNENRGNRREQRTEIKLGRFQMKEVAYQSGIDPMASMWGGISSITSTLGSTASSLFGGRFHNKGGQMQRPNQGLQLPTFGNNNQPLPEKEGFFDRILTALGL